MLLDTGRERAGGRDARRVPSWRNVGGGLVMTVAALVAGAATVEAERLCLEAPRKRNAEEPARPHLLSGLPSSGIQAG